LGPPRSPKDLFLAVLDLPPATREEFLERETAGDCALRAAVERLLRAHRAAHPLLDAGTPSLPRASPAEPTADEDLGPGSELGPYRLEDLLGEGGFGRVFRAEQREPVRRRVALKVLRPGLDRAGVAARFDAERELLARLDHPHIARVLDAGRTPAGRPFLVLELVDGRPITDLELPLRRRLELFHQVCLAIHHAHTKGVLHRDIKASNVLVVERDGRLEPRVIDFGIARTFEGEALSGGALTLDGHLLGTPVAMSPEQFDEPRSVDTRSDVYALGVLLYELLTGRPPFEFAGHGLAALLALQAQVRHGEPQRPSARAPRAELPADLDWIALRCLEKDRERRYPTAFALARDVLAFLEDRPVEASPPSVPYRLRKWVKRHRTAAALSAVAALALVTAVVGIGFASWRTADANRRLDRALQSAVVEAEEASRQMRIATGVADFLARDVLSAVRPSMHSEGLGRDASMVQVLDTAARRLADPAVARERFGGDPAVEAKLRFAIGQSYSALGQASAAWPHLERALQLSAELGGPSAPDVLRCHSALARLELELDRDAEALARLEAQLPAIRAEFGEGSAEHAGAAQLQGRALLAAGRAEEALALFRATEAAASARLGADHEITLANLSSQTQALESLRRWDEARALHDLVVERRTRSLGPEDPDSLAARANRAMFLSARGDLSAALPELAAVVADQRRILGVQHRDTVVAGLALGLAQRAVGELDAALAAIAETLVAAEAGLGPANGTTLQVLAELARTHEAREERERAEELLRELLERVQDGTPADHPLQANARTEFGTFLLRAGRPAEAEPWLREAAERLEAHYGREHVQLVLAYTRLGEALGDQGQTDAAIELQREAWARAAGLSPVHPEVLNVRSKLANLELDRGDPEAALELVRAAYDDALAELGPHHRYTRQSAEAVSAVLSILGRDDEAAHWSEVAAQAAAGGQ
jgi:serine/threonine protein kinase/tetratricopeptide (TPR) repeat protein